MTDAIHEAATHHLPSFVTAPGQTDVLMVVMAVVLLLSVMGFGIFFLRLHTLPERIAHRTHKIQFEIVAILGLIALFTHMHIFWIAGLLLAFIELPDFGTSLNRIADSTETIAGMKPAQSMASPHETGAILELDSKSPGAAAESPHFGKAREAAKVSDTPTSKKELSHA